MPRLTTERYLQARAFLLDHARPLEVALFEHDFEGAPAWPVFDALSAFQNDDGGFGNGLEPDALTPSSGALASSVALRTLVEVGAPASHPMVRSLVGYLTSAFDAASDAWRIVPVDTGDHPHAPWWAQEGLAERFNRFRLNPKAEIVAHLYTLRAEVDEQWLAEQARSVLRAVEEAMGTMGGLEMHDLIAACRLLDAAGVPLDLHGPLRERLEEAATSALRAGSNGGYGLRALNVASRPDSALADKLADNVVLELERLIDDQAADGAWWPSWDWGASAGPSAEAWARSKVAWAGIITLENLRALNAHNLIDRG